MPGAPSDLELKRTLDAAGALTGFAMGVAMALDALIDIDLPPGADAQIDQAQMRAIASLYLASDLETAGVLPAVETLAGLTRSGAIGVDLGPATAMLQAFWKARNDRATPAERGAFFARLFGTQVGPAPTSAAGVNAEFEDHMLDLCEALYKLDELAVNPTYGGTAQQARVRAAAQGLAANLVHAGGGITAFFAQEILQSLKEALAILAVPQLRAVMRAHDTWAAITGIYRLAGQAAADPTPYARRGKAGMTVLAWLAEAAPLLGEPAQPLVGLDHPVIGAAVEWMETSLSIGESAPQGPSAAAPAPLQPASPWAAIGA
jgi:hypothetical protein